LNNRCFIYFYTDKIIKITAQTEFVSLTVESEKVVKPEEIKPAQIFYLTDVGKDFTV